MENKTGKFTTVDLEKTCDEGLAFIKDCTMTVDGKSVNFKLKVVWDNCQLRQVFVAATKDAVSDFQNNLRPKSTVGAKNVEQVEASNKLRKAKILGLSDKITDVKMVDSNKRLEVTTDEMIAAVDSVSELERLFAIMTAKMAELKKQK